MKTKFLLILLVTSFSCFGQVKDSLFNITIDQLISHSVPTLKTENILRIKQKHLLDCREFEEFEVSHIPSATYVGYDQFKKKNLPEMGLNDTIITYCSIGYRSEKIAEKLVKMGYTNVFNYHGSIFEWVNKGNQVVTPKNTPTDTVHVYSKLWGVWLQKGQKVY